MAGMLGDIVGKINAMPQGQAAPQRTGMLGGIQNFFEKNRGQGNFTDRLNMFGAQLQDINDGGGRAQSIGQQRATAAQQEGEAAQRQHLNQLAQGLNLSPQERLIFAANPLKFAELLSSQQTPYNLGAGDQRMIGDRVVASRPANPVTYNTARGLYQVPGGGGEGQWIEEFEPDPLEQELLRARIGATQAQIGQRDAQAARARRPAAASRPSAQTRSYQPSGIRWD